MTITDTNIADVLLGITLIAFGALVMFGVLALANAAKRGDRW